MRKVKLKISFRAGRCLLPSVCLARYVVLGLARLWLQAASERRERVDGPYTQPHNRVSKNNNKSIAGETNAAPVRVCTAQYTPAGV